MAARSTAVHFLNGTRNTRLYRVDYGLQHGEWSSEPPSTVEPGQDVSWQSESAGFMTGTEGYVRYYPVDATTDSVGIPSPAPDAATVYLYWDNPWAGSNSYNQSAPALYAVNRAGDGSGDNASISFSLGGAYGPDTCLPGYVWREAFPGDHVCVLPEARDRAQQDNVEAGSRRNPGGGDFGPDTCRQGYVWREASSSDHVCVIPETRSQAAEDNQRAGQRVL